MLAGGRNSRCNSLDYFLLGFFLCARFFSGNIITKQTDRPTPHTTLAPPRTRLALWSVAERWHQVKSTGGGPSNWDARPEGDAAQAESKEAFFPKNLILNFFWGGDSTFFS